MYESLIHPGASKPPWRPKPKHCFWLFLLGSLAVLCIVFQHGARLAWKEAQQQTLVRYSGKAANARPVGNVGTLSVETLTVRESINKTSVLASDRTNISDPCPFFDDMYREVLKEDTQASYGYLLVSGLIKPKLWNKFFPTHPKNPPGLTDKMAITAIISLSVAGAYSDLKRVITVLWDTGAGACGSSFRYLLLFLALIPSGNMTSLTVLWGRQQDGSLRDGQDGRNFDSTLMVYFSVMNVIYGLPLLVCGFLFYFLVVCGTGPILLLHSGMFQSQAVQTIENIPILDEIFNFVIGVIGLLSAVPVLGCMWGCGQVLLKIVGDYTNATNFTLVILIAQMLSPIWIRLVLGQGFWQSVVATWEDRSFVTYVLSMFKDFFSVTQAANSLA